MGKWLLHSFFSSTKMKMYLIVKYIGYRHKQCSIKYVDMIEACIMKSMKYLIIKMLALSLNKSTIVYASSWFPLLWFSAHPFLVHFIFFWPIFVSDRINPKLIVIFKHVIMIRHILSARLKIMLLFLSRLLSKFKIT